MERCSEQALQKIMKQELQDLPREVMEWERSMERSAGGHGVGTERSMEREVTEWERSMERSAGGHGVGTEHGAGITEISLSTEWLLLLTVHSHAVL